MLSYLRQTWKMLGRNIYTGDRDLKNLRSTGYVSLLVTVIGIVMSIMNIVQGYYDTLIVSLVICVCGSLMYYFSSKKKNRGASALTATFFVIITFTFVTVRGTMNGFAILWTTLVPLVMCYFFSVKYGILLLIYFEILFCIVFYTPLRQIMAEYYSPTMMNRYPVLYLSLGVMTSLFMIQYHKSILDQMDYTEQLQEAKQLAESANTAKSDFLADMSHEIRTPINAVLGMNEMILRDSFHARNTFECSGTEEKEYFNSMISYAGNIESAGNNLLSIINDILDFSKIEAGKLEIVEAEYKLGSVLNDVSNMIFFKAKDKSLEFAVHIDETLPDSLYGDEVRVRQIITNILNNAVKYTPHGSVTLRIVSEATDAIEPGQTIHLKISVQDTGIGIKPEDMEKLFAKFQRVDLKRNSTIEGTGLGLAITRSLLELMGGTIQVESEYGAGSTFTVTIPQKVVSTEPVGDFQTKFARNIQESKAYETTFLAPDAHILIVDDTKMNLSVAVGLLKHTDIKCDTASCGKEAIQMALTTSYDLILMDQRMPKMDGTEALHLIRKQENGLNRETPVICLTADAVKGARERYIADGFTDYLTKPVDSVALEKMLIKHLPGDKIQIVDNVPGKETVPGKKETSRQQDMSTLTEEDPCPLLRAAGIDPETGLTYCQNDEAFYQSLLFEYAHEAEGKLQDMQHFYEAKDWQNYAILVHALKSSSRMIGASGLSDMAAALEAAANQEKEQDITAGHEAMVRCCRNIIEQILQMQDNKALSDTTGEESGSDDEILEFFPEEDD